MGSIVISLGGSVILSEVDIDADYFKKLNSLLERLAKKYRTYIIAGGGRTARTYIRLGRSIGFDEKTLDEIGIEATRINALFLTKLISISNNKIPNTIDGAIELENKIVIMGGTTPGHSTDMVGAELAKKANAVKYIIATNVDGVFDKDPNIYSDAKQLKEISIKELIKHYGTGWNMAGKNTVIDGPALEIISRANIPTFVLNGKKIEELEKAIFDKKFNGTIIKK